MVWLLLVSWLIASVMIGPAVGRLLASRSAHPAKAREARQPVVVGSPVDAR